MKSPLQLDLEWLPSDRGSPEERATAAELRITLDDEVVTTVDDSWAHSVRDSVRVSVWPLAMWFASSWWRLRWEAADASLLSTSFRAAHDVVSVGAGYVWPRLSLRTDGEFVDVISRASLRAVAEPIRYLTNYQISIPGEEFERAVRGFIETTIARLDVLGVRQSSLHQLWSEVGDEMSDPEFSNYRRTEARLGFDPDEVPPEVIERFLDLEEDVGEAAGSEIATIAFRADPLRGLSEVEGLSDRDGVHATLDTLRQVQRLVTHDRRPDPTPADRGRTLARELRKALGVTSDRIEDGTLSDLMGTTVDWKSRPPDSNGPIGLAVIEDGAGRLLFRRRAETGRRFEAARFVGDYLGFATRDRWLPSTDAHTARQKTQRAFASEFLAPIEVLKDRLAGDFSQERVEDEAQYLGVSSLVIWSSLANNKAISPELVPGFEL